MSGDVGVDRGPSFFLASPDVPMHLPEHLPMTPAETLSTPAVAPVRFDVEHARFNMVEQQIRTWEVLDQDVLDLLFRVRREDYVPSAYRELAFADLELPLGDGERMWTPKMEARVLQELKLQANDVVLEIGTGGGYFTALLAARGADVTSVEIIPRLHAQAQARLRRGGVGNARVVAGDGAQGFGSDQYDAIVLTGSTPVLPDAWLTQLKPGGRLFAVVGDAPVMTARLLRWTAPGAITTEDVFETVIAPLQHAAQPRRFVF
jgi:protein-L-isoaspartate(D-aspartate) O-methyltransferase